MNKKINICLVGVGIMGQKHARIYSEMPEAKLKAVVDINVQQAEKVAERFNVDTVSNDVRSVIADQSIHAVHIATPDHTHVEPISLALKSGKHVLVEKPLATTVEDASKIVALSKETKRHVMVNYTHRWAAPYAKTKQLIEQGDLGEGLMVYARKDDSLWAATEMMNWTSHTSPASYLSTHDIDLATWMLKTTVTSVYALSVRRVLAARGIDTDDAVQALVRFANGAIGTFESCWVLPNSMPTVTDSFMELVGSKGTVHIDRIHEGLKIATEQNYSYPKLSLECEVQERMTGGITLCLQYFVRCLLNGLEPRPNATDGLHIVKISDAINRSIKQGEVINIKNES